MMGMDYILQQIVNGLILGRSTPRMIRCSMWSHGERMADSQGMGRRMPEVTIQQKRKR